MNRKKWKWFGLVLMVAGAACLAYPYFTSQAVKKAQTNLESDWETLNETYQDYDFSEKEDSQPDGQGDEGKEKDLRGVIEENDLVGQLSIPKIDLNVMIAPGADQETLRDAVGWLPSTSLPDEKSNTVLAGHRSNTYGQFFNRAGELEKGDEMTVETLDGSHTYRVYDTEMVDPTELSVLDQGDDSELTLVTCELYSDAHRLIIKGKEVEE